MIEIKLTIGDQSRLTALPSGWHEVTPEQFVYIVSHELVYGELPTQIIYHLLRATDYERRCLKPADIYAISQYLTWLQSYDTISHWVLSSITLPDGRKCFPPDDDWDNMTWEEFVFADQLAAVGNWDAVAACLFRPHADVVSEDADPRIPFSRVGATNRLPLFRKLTDATFKAVEINYLLLRRLVTDRYPHLFTSSQSSRSQSSTSWVDVTSQVLGDSIWEEPQLLHTSVHQVLAHLDHVIHENSKRTRNAKNR